MTHSVTKRLLSVLAALLLVFSVSVCRAEETDLSRLTDDQLEALLLQVSAEIVSRGLRKTATLPKGAYIVGRDIPAGSYIYTSLAKGDDWGNVTVYSDGGDGKQLLWEIVSAPDEGEEPDTVFMKLNEGDRLKSDVPFSLTIAGSALFR